MARAWDSTRFDISSSLSLLRAGNNNNIRIPLKQGFIVNLRPGFYSLLSPDIDGANYFADRSKVG